MPRPRLQRRIGQLPNFTYFGPKGVGRRILEEVILTLDEAEAIRLIDLDGLDQTVSAKKMNISQPTFHRLLFSARKKIADALLNGKSIKIQGGNYKIVGQNPLGAGFRRGFGRGQCRRND